MARVNLDLGKRSNNLEVGDIVINPMYGIRMIVRYDAEYLGVDPETGEACGNGVELSDLEDMYCQGEFRIIKADNIEISEVGGRI